MRFRLNRRVRSVLLAAALGAVPLAMSGPALAAPKPATGATFNANLLLQGSSNVAEPSIRTDRFGRSFVIGPTGVPAGCKAWRGIHDGSAASHFGPPDPTPRGGACAWGLRPHRTLAAVSPPAAR